MNDETLKVYAPCPLHGLWKDVDRDCYYCVVENVERERQESWRLNSSSPNGSSESSRTS